MSSGVEQEDADVNGKGAATVNGDPGGHGYDGGIMENRDPVVSPEMLYKLSKKIAQLTKVIYSLNTRNDDLELDMENMRSGYEERLMLCQQQLSMASNNLTSLAGEGTLSGMSSEDGEPPPNNGTGSRKTSTSSRRSKTPEASDSETKKELKKARLAVKQLESKVKTLEKESREKSSALEKQHEARNGNEGGMTSDHKLSSLEEKVRTSLLLSYRH